MFGLPRWGIYALGALLLIAAFLAERTAYGNRRFNAGEAHADEAWKKASDKLITKAANAGTKADTKAAARQADFAAKQEDEKEKIDAAVQHGSSPLDVLFGG
jgi:hypothetical protein